MSMRKNILKTLLIASVISASLLVGCGKKDNNEATPTTSEVESTIVEDVTTSEPIVEETTSEEVTSEVEEPTTIVEKTTKAPELATQAPTPAPTPTPAPAPTPAPTPVVDATTAKIRSLHLAYVPEEAVGSIDWELSQKEAAFVMVPGERAMADYVDNYGDGTKPNPYTMYEWTTRKYYAERDEETLGFYIYKEDYEDSSNLNGICQTRAREASDAYTKGRDGFGLNGIDIYIGTYEGRDIYFCYYFN